MFITEKVEASSTFTVCNSCSSSSSYQYVANGFANSGFDTIYVANYNDVTLQKYEIFQLPPEPGLPVRYAVMNRPVNNDEATSFTTLIDTRNLILSGLATRHVPSGVVESAYDLVGSTAKLNDLKSFYNDQLFNIVDASLISLNAAFSAFGILDFGGVTTTLYFADGSELEFRMTGFSLDLNNGLTVTLEVVSAKDKDNNTISFESSGYTSGEYRFTKGGETALLRFVDAGARLHVFISYAGGYSGGSVTINDLEIQLH